MTVKAFEVVPALTSTLAGTDASAGFELVSVTFAPVGLSVSEASVAAAAGLTVTVVVLVTPLYVAERVANVWVVTVDVAIPNVAEVAPWLTDTLPGTVTALLALPSETTAPPEGA